MFVNERQGSSLFNTASVQGEQSIQPEGTFGLIRFAPDATAGDMSKVLESRKIAIIDGPSGNGMYRVRFAMTAIPKEDLAKLLKSLQDESTVRFVAKSPAD
jgi:hypothetical protein